MAELYQPSGGGGGTTATTPILLSSTQVNLNEETGAKQTLYTVPASRKAIITNVVLQHFSSGANVAHISLGWDDPPSDATTHGTVDLSGYPTSNNAVILGLQDVAGSTSLLDTSLHIGLAGESFGLSVGTPEGSALTAQVDVYGYLTDINGVPQPNVGGGASTVTLNQVSDVTATASEVNALHGVKRYVVLLSQSGEDDPTAIVLENSLGGTVVWTRSSAGSYVGTLNGVFTVNKTWIIAATHGLSGVGAAPGSVNAVTVQTDGDDALDGNAIEIRVFP
jgi:hypothetical protein